MIRKIIKIDETQCDGCGLCARACQEGAIVITDGKARLVREDYCDGLGNCLPACPTGAITFEEREAAEYDEKAVKRNIAVKHTETLCGDSQAGDSPCGCPGARAQTIEPGGAAVTAPAEAVSELRQWPVQIKLVPVCAPFYENADLLIAADCAAYARGNFHAEFMRNKITLIGCPKLDNADYSEKLTEIIKQNNIKSVTVVRMAVPCCGGIEYFAAQALKNAGKTIPCRVVTLGIKGEIEKE